MAALTRWWIVLAVGALALVAPPALAVDPPHLATRSPTQGCQDCHQIHGALGSALQRDAVACLGCHASQALPPRSQWSGADQATPGAGGTSHRWDSASAVSAASGATLPSDPAMRQRAMQGLGCPVCHDPHSEAKAPFGPGPAGRNHFLRVPNADGGLCLQCHSSRDVPSASTWTGGAQSHPISVALPAGDLTFHARPQDAAGPAVESSRLLLVSGGQASQATGVVTCMTCHGVHYADSDTATEDDRPRGGDGNLLRRSLTGGGQRGSSAPARDDACVGCHAVSGHAGDTAAGDRYTFSFGCKDCHATHGTRNVMLVRETLSAAPGSSTPGVDLRTLTAAPVGGPDASSGVPRATGGVGAYDLANAAAPGTGPCEACHTQTRDRAASGAQPRFRSAGGGTAGRHFANQCLACHPHRGGFKGREPGVGAEPTGQACYPCHAYGMRSADEVALKRRTYHHVVEADGVAGYAPGATPTAAVDGDKRCIQCHVDHPFGASRAANLRTSVTDATPASADRSAAAPHGVCLSCHAAAQVKNTTDQKDDGTTATAPIDAAAFATSAHRYGSEPSGTVFKPGGGSFTVACVKCHADGQPTATQAGPASFALHASPDRRLRNPLGITQFAHGGDALEEAFCYRCHSASTDPSPGGGPAKASTAFDAFGAVTTMSPGSTGLFAQMQKGSAGIPGGPTTTTRTLWFQPSGPEDPAAPAAPAPDAATFATDTLFLRNGAEELPAEPMSNGWLLASGNYDTSVYRGRSMTPVQGSTSEAVILPWGNRFIRQAQFTSPPFATRVAWTAGTQLGFWFGGAQNNHNCYLGWAMYRWNADDTLGTQVVAASLSTTDLEPRWYPAPDWSPLHFTSDATFEPGDKLLLEVEIKQPWDCGWCACGGLWGSAANPSRLVLPARPDGHLPEFRYQAPASGGGTWAGRSMSPYPPPGLANEAREASSAAVPDGTRLWQRTSFVSPPLAAATTTTAAPWTISLFERQGAAAANAHLRYKVYPLRADQSAGTDIVTWGTWAATLPTSTSRQTITTPPGAAVPLAVGDRIVVDLEVETLNVATALATGLELTFGPTRLSSLVMPAPATFAYADRGTPAVGRHDVAAYSGVHRPNPMDEDRAYLSANRHVECEDCHDPHSTQPGRHTPGSNLAGPALRGAPAVSPSPRAANWDTGTAPTYTPIKVGVATPEAYVCFRCHSSYNMAIPEDPSGLPAAPWATGGGGFTNTALEFSPSNASGHPVLAALSDYPNSLEPKLLTPDQLCNPTTCPPASNPGMRTWTPGQKMTCTDCHGADSASPAAQGPHGSALRYMLAGPNRAWPYTVAGATSGTPFALAVNTEDNLGSPGGNGLFCRNCHPTPYRAGPENGGRGAATNDMHWRMGWGHGFTPDFGAACPNGCRDCVRCHIVVPHGGKVSRLIATVNAPARYQVPGVGPLFTGFTKAPNRWTDYWNRFTLDPQWGCGSGHYSDTPPLEAW